MKVFLKRLALVVLSIIVTTRVVSWVTETYFFDKFIFQKSTEYGYFVPSNSQKPFGKREEDLLALKNLLKAQGEASSGVLGTTSSGPFTIAVIGDSYVWGQGLRNEDRFAYVLEKKLNTVMPTKVVSLGAPGSDVFDYYLLYRDVKKVTPDINLYVFGLVENDLMINPISEDEQFKNMLIGGCQNPISFNHYENDPNNNNKTYEQMIQEAYDDSFVNQCFFREVLPLFPQKNALYLSMEYYKSDEYLQKYIQPFSDKGRVVINPKYEAYLREDEYPVSKKEGHPSKKMNQVYADVLFKEIQNTDSFKTKKAAYLLGRN